MLHTPRYRYGLLLLLLLATALLLSYRALTPTAPSTPAALRPYLLSEPRSIQSPLIPAALDGQWIVAFIGYTHCPDICPTTLAHLSIAAQQPDLQGLPLGYLFISVDPQRDTLDSLRQFTAYFSPTFQATTGSREAIDALVRQLGGLYLLEGDLQSNRYQVQHSASLYLISPQRQLIAQINPPYEPTPLATTLRQLIDFIQPNPPSGGSL